MSKSLWNLKVNRWHSDSSDHELDGAAQWVKIEDYAELHNETTRIKAENSKALGQLEGIIVQLRMRAESAEASAVLLIEKLSTLKAEAPVERPKLKNFDGLPASEAIHILIQDFKALESYATSKEAEVRKLEARLKDAIQDAEDGDTVIESLNRIFTHQRNCQDCQALEKLKAENAELKLSTPPHNNGDAVKALEEILPRFLEACEELARGMGSVKPESKAGTFMHNLNYVQFHFKALRASKQAGLK